MVEFKVRDSNTRHPGPIFFSGYSKFSPGIDHKCYKTRDTGFTQKDTRVNADRG